MPDFYNAYKPGFVDLVALRNNKFYSNQLIVFDYKTSPGQKIALVVGEHPHRTLHCLKLNEINPLLLNKTLHSLTDRKLLSDYEESIKKSLYDERLRLNEYRFPFVTMNSQPAYYSTYIKKLKVVPNIYRTYDITKMLNVNVVVPDLKYFKFISPHIVPDESTTVVEKLGYLDDKIEPKDYRLDDSLGKQKKGFDE